MAGSSSTKPLIRVIGSINVDFTTVTPRFPRPGETLTATSLTVNAGGKGANQAVACGRASIGTKEGRQDVRVEMVGAVGAEDPYYGSLIRPTLEEAGVDCARIVQQKDCQTGTATIIVDQSSKGENRILIVPGANHEGMSPSPALLETALTHEEPDAIMMQGEIPKETVFGILEQSGSQHGPGKGPLTIFNPAPVYEGGVPARYLKMVAVLVVNETELTDLLKHLDHETITRLPDEPQHGQVSSAVLRSAAQGLHRLGVRLVVVTLGAEGVYYSLEGSEADVIPGTKIDRVVDTTAAGDTFVGYLAVSLLRSSQNLETALTAGVVRNALQTANAAAARCVQKSGAMQSIPWGYE